jgi:hypothetical protein
VFETEILILEELDRLSPPADSESADWEDALRRAEIGAMTTTSPPGTSLLVRSRSRGRWLVFAVLVSASAVAVLLITAPWSGEPTLLQRAEAAMTLKPGTILHMRYVSVDTDLRTGVVTRRVKEIWRDSNGRFRALLLPGPGGTRDEVGGTWYGTGATRSPGPTLIFDPAANTIETASFEVAFGDPLAGIRKALADKRVRGAGTTMINGRRVERLRATAKGDETEAFIDPRTDYPVEWRVTYSRVSDVTRFQLYEYLPATAQNLRLTSLKAEHPHAKVIPG